MDIENEKDMFKDLPKKPSVEIRKADSIQDDQSNTYSGYSGYLVQDEIHRLPDTISKGNKDVNALS